jgi:hypothetical protein
MRRPRDAARSRGVATASATRAGGRTHGAGRGSPAKHVQQRRRINFSIAAASIIAKTHRDALMEALDREYPGYGFATHKGYGTPEHREALLCLGPSAVHRMSFPVLHELRGEYSALFYVLKDRLEAARTRTTLGEFETELRAQVGKLAEPESKASVAGGAAVKPSVSRRVCQPWCPAVNLARRVTEVRRS